MAQDPRVARMGSTHLAVYVCSHVFDGSHPILLVAREDGDWQFLCGGGHANETPRVVGLAHILERDEALLELYDMPDDWEAEREGVGKPWVRRACEEE